MSYYNDVRILTTVDGYNYFKKVVEKNCKTYDTFNPLEEVDFLNINEGKNEVYIGWNDVSWWGDYYYKGALVIKTALDELPAVGYSYRFARIGEEFDDIVSIGEDGEKEEDVLDYIEISRKFNDFLFYNSKEI